ncbi:MAG: 3-deoxy-manno-octulosonate cytidylyltransferase [Verrucomicrobia bacterium]|nr:3-deoxy-manno-octulosonate cytidylyltransferase [Verrucomicrobiota bacterium]
MARIIGIIPARYAATRLPGKMLLDIAGKPLIMHTYERARAAKLLDRVLVATDDTRILEAVTAAGGEAVMTAGAHRCGSDRVAEAAKAMDCDIVVNVQGDEITIEPALIDTTVHLLLDNAEADVGTIACPITTVAEYADRDVVKVIFDEAGRALYFSRAPIPHSKHGAFTAQTAAYRHIGIYSFRRDALMRFAAFGPSPLELAEDLEQLRALEHGARIAVALATEHSKLKIDTLDELEKARAVLCRSTSL